MKNYPEITNVSCVIYQVVDLFSSHGYFSTNIDNQKNAEY